MSNKVKFSNIYSNLPLGLRNEIIVVIDDMPLTWNAARIEIENDTDKAELILEKLVQLGVIK